MHAATLPTASSSRTARRRLLALSLGAVSIIVTRASQAADAVAPEPPLLQRRDLSLRNEVQHAVDRGLDWLAAHQNSNGWWSTPDQPAVSALALTAFKGDPQDRYLS